MFFNAGDLGKDAGICRNMLINTISTAGCGKNGIMKLETSNVAKWVFSR